MHTINTEIYRGILGTKGTPATEDLYYGPMSKSDRIIEADVIGGSWFMESDWVKLMFRDKIHSWASGEDWHLCANARKYANIRSFVMPVDPLDTSAHSFSADYRVISQRGDTTGIVIGTAESRKHIIEQLWSRGDRLMDSYKKSKPSLLIFAETNADAFMLVEYSKIQLTALGVTVSCATPNAVKAGINITKLKGECHSFHDFLIGRDYNVETTPIGTAAEVMYAFDMVLQGTQSTTVMTAGSGNTAAKLAVLGAASLRNIPVINIYVNENILKSKIAKAILAMSTHTVEASINRTLDSTNARKLNSYLVQLYN
jgi:hypothetical protein